MADPQLNLALLASRIEQLEQEAALRKKNTN